jgi:hypothetical protein
MATTDRLLISKPSLSALRDLLRRYDTFVSGALLFILALALRLYRLDAQSLWLDEGGTWAEVTGKGWLALLAELWSRDAAYPLYHVLRWASRATRSGRCASPRRWRARARSWRSTLPRAS